MFQFGPDNHSGIDEQSAAKIEKNREPWNSLTFITQAAPTQARGGSMFEPVGPAKN